jgi:hypothetical protein
VTIKDVALMLDGREYGSEVSPREETEFKNAGIVVVYGYSDDCVEFEGAVNTEIGIWNTGNIPLLNGVPFDVPCATEEFETHCCPLLKEVAKRLKYIKSKFGVNGWEFDADFPCEKFTVVEEGDAYGVGLIYALADLVEVQDEN